MTEKETLGGQGATRERLRKSRITTAPRISTVGGMVLSYGQHDTEHCTLDVLQNKGFIESDQYDAGYHLRNLFYSFNTTGRWIEEGGKAYDGDTITPKDIAESEYHSALRSVNPQDRALTRAVCVEYTFVPADYVVIRSIQYGLSDLVNYFKNNKKN
jgi:hypothetical protein